MLKAIGQRFVSLGRDEDGVAFVVTIAVFFFMYLMIAGVYAVGTAVKERVQLQNACDAAAYSAAVVQADTLSRIATLNRAMAWTYVSMTRRQMDYIVYKWLDKTLVEYGRDSDRARGSGSYGRHPFHPYWDIGSTLRLLAPVNDRFHRNFSGTDDICFHDRYSVLSSQVKDEHDKFPSYDELFGLSFYANSLPSGGVSRLGEQIDEDGETIREMNHAEQELQDDLYERMKQAAESVLQANLNDSDHVRYRLIAEERPLKGNDAYLRYVTGNEEGRFLTWCGLSSDVLKVFENGIDLWFVRRNDGQSFHREYAQNYALKSSWHWQSWEWYCPPRSSCYLVPVSSGSGFVLGSQCRDSRFVGQGVSPLVLTADYFGKAGTITVGLARKNENPWLWLFEQTGKALGIYSAFNPFCQWSWAFASAKAGYKHLGEERYVTGEDGNWYPNREYRIDWDDNNQSWNLCQSDWDAVMVPVRCAESNAQNRNWEIGNTGMLEDYVDGEWKWLSADDDSDVVVIENRWGEMLAGGTRTVPDDWGRVLMPGDDPWEWVNSFPTGEPDNTGHVKAQWQIGNPGTRLDWSKLAERMFH